MIVCLLVCVCVSVVCVCECVAVLVSWCLCFVCVRVALFAFICVLLIDSCKGTVDIGMGCVDGTNIFYQVMDDWIELMFEIDSIENIFMHDLSSEVALFATVYMSSISSMNMLPRICQEECDDERIQMSISWIFDDASMAPTSSGFRDNGFGIEVQWAGLVVNYLDVWMLYIARGCHCYVIVKCVIPYIELFHDFVEHCVLRVPYRWGGLWNICWT